MGYILQKGQAELILFNNLYTQTRFFNEDWERRDMNNRISYFSGIFEATYGISANFDVGLDAFYEAVHQNQSNDNPVEVLKFEQSKRAHHDLTGILPKVKFTPLNATKELSLETGLLIPLANDPEGLQIDRPFLSNDQYEWWTEVFHVHDFNKRWQLFTEVDAYWRFGDNGLFTEGGSINTPAKVFLSWFPASRWSFYGMAEYNPSWGDNLWSSVYYQNGLGVKHQLTETLELELLYTDFLAGKNQGAGRTFNVGIRFQR